MSYFPPYLIDRYAFPSFEIINSGEKVLPKWTQKTIYREPPPNHALHIAKAEAKRARKAAKRNRHASRAALAQGGE